MSRLYCTATSEKASKGQGGSELAITIRDSEGIPCMLITVWDTALRPEAHVYFSARINEPLKQYVMGADLIESVKRAEEKLKTKGKRQKGEPRA